MSPLKLAITIVVYIIAVLAVLLLGDYLGYKIGRRKLLSICGLTALGIVVAFAIFAAIYLFTT